jgi:hypothetical protein
MRRGVVKTLALQILAASFTFAQRPAELTGGMPPTCARCLLASPLRQEGAAGAPAPTQTLAKLGRRQIAFLWRPFGNLFRR